MTHVFVAPHPDDVALSCGGLIASLRELGQTVTILTVFSGEGGPGEGLGNGLTDYQREALGFGSKTMWPVTEAFNRVHIAPDADVYGAPGALPAWAATRRPARGDPGRRRRGGEAVLAALLVVSAGEHPPRAARGPAGHRRPADTGRRRDRRSGRRRPGRRHHGEAPARGRGVRPVRRGVDRVPRPARRRVPRLRGRQRASRRAARRRLGALRDPPPRDRPARAAEGVPAARRREPRRPPAVPRRRRRGSSPRVAAG